MIKVNVLRWLIVMMVVVGITGCAAIPNQTRPRTVFKQPIDKTQQAAIKALVAIGCDLKIQEPAFVKGFRPQEFRFARPSGGETIRIWLEAIDPQTTAVVVTTGKFYVGMAGQKNWDEVVLQEMRKSLGE